MSEGKQTGGRDDWIEMVIAGVLSAAGLLTSWSSYQASLWDGAQAAQYTRANALRVVASRVQLETDSHRAIEAGLFNAWLEAKAGDKDVLAAFYEERFPPDLKPAFQAWIAQNPLKNPAAAPSPFSMNTYRPKGEGQDATLEAQADAAFDKGQEDNRISDVFTQGTVFLAMALFFGGIGQVFKVRIVRLALVVIAAVSCGVGLATIVSLPTLSPG